MRLYALPDCCVDYVCLSHLRSWSIGFCGLCNYLLKYLGRSITNQTRNQDERHLCVGNKSEGWWGAGGQGLGATGNGLGRSDGRGRRPCFETKSHPNMSHLPFPILQRARQPRLLEIMSCWPCWCCLVLLISIGAWVCWAVDDVIAWAMHHG